LSAGINFVPSLRGTIVVIEIALALLVIVFVVCMLSRRSRKK